MPVLWHSFLTLNCTLNRYCISHELTCLRARLQKLNSFEKALAAQLPFGALAANDSSPEWLEHERRMEIPSSGQEGSSTNHLWGAPGDFTPSVGVTCFQSLLGWLGKGGYSEEMDFLKIRKHIHILGSVYAINTQRLNRYCFKRIKIPVESLYQSIFLGARNKSCDSLKHKKRVCWKTARQHTAWEGRRHIQAWGRAEARVVSVSSPGAAGLPWARLPLQSPLVPVCLHKIPIPKTLSGLASVMSLAGWGQGHNKVT